MSSIRAIGLSSGGIGISEIDEQGIVVCHIVTVSSDQVGEFLDDVNVIIKNKKTKIFDLNKYFQHMADAEESLYKKDDLLSG